MTSKLLNYARICVGDDCPHNDGGKFVRKDNGLPKGVGGKWWLECSKNKDHFRWPNLEEMGLVNKQSRKSRKGGLNRWVKKIVLLVLYRR